MSLRPATPMIEDDVQGNLVSPRARQGGRIVFFTKSRATRQQLCRRERSGARGRPGSPSGSAECPGRSAERGPGRGPERGRSAARTAATAAQATAQSQQHRPDGRAARVQQGVYTARKWAAPEAGARRRATPPRRSRRPCPRPCATPPAQVQAGRQPGQAAGPRSTWSLLGAAVVAAAGAVAALIRYQFRAATADETVEVGEATDVSGQPAGADAGRAGDRRPEQGERDEQPERTERVDRQDGREHDGEQDGREQDGSPSAVGRRPDRDRPLMRQ